MVRFPLDGLSVRAANPRSSPRMAARAVGEHEAAVGLGRGWRSAQGGPLRGAAGGRQRPRRGSTRARSWPRSRKTCVSAAGGLVGDAPWRCDEPGKCAAHEALQVARGGTEPGARLLGSAAGGGQDARRLEGSGQARRGRASRRSAARCEGSFNVARTALAQMTVDTEDESELRTQLQQRLLRYRMDDGGFVGPVIVKQVA
eukprot:scaffold803_cov310-Pinguiococcus_pyrenoidosus.AAC.24